jgi:hypothetical protein
MWNVGGGIPKAWDRSLPRGRPDRKSLSSIKDDSGLTILEVLIAAGVASGVALMLANMMVDNVRSQKSISQLSSFDATVGNVSRVLATSQCNTAFKNATGSPSPLVVAPSGTFPLPVPEISVGTSVIAQNLQELGSGMKIEKLELKDPQDLGTVEDGNGITRKQIMATLSMKGALNVHGGPVGVSDRTQNWNVTFLTDQATNAVTGCLGVPSSGGGVTNPATGTGVQGHLAMWDGVAGRLTSSALFQTPAGTTGKIGIGTQTPIDLLTVDGSPIGDRGITLDWTSNNQDNGNINFKLAGGAPGAKTAVAFDQEIGHIAFHGYDGTDYSWAAGIVARVDGAPSPGNVPSRLEFYTKDPAEAFHSIKMIIKPNGNVGIGTINPEAPLHITSASGGYEGHLKYGIFSGPSNPEDLLLYSYADGDGSKTDIDIHRARGTKAAPTAVLGTTELGPVFSFSATG